MKIAFFSAKPYEIAAFQDAAPSHALTYFDARLTEHSVGMAAGCPALCVFVNDKVDAACLEKFAAQGGKLVLLRSAGFNHVDSKAAARLGITILRVPEYSPYAVAEYAVALILSLNRKIHRAFNRVREGNFALDGLTGFDLHGKKVGVLGVGKIGSVFCKIMHGFGCSLMVCDPVPNEELHTKYGAQFVSKEDMCRSADVISLHAPLNAQTRHIIDADALGQMKKGMMLINTSRGALIDARALIDALKTGRVGAAGLDVYEEEDGVFFADHSGDILQDDTLARLMTFPNVLITSHQAFLTHEALHNIATVTLQNASDFENGRKLTNEVRAG